MPKWLSPVISGVTGLLGAGSEIYGTSKEIKMQKETNDFNAQQAQKQMDFQERMSSSAHQREVKDLVSAGLNPILSSQYGGSSTPPGAMSQATSPGQNLGAKYGSATRAFNENRLTAEQLKTQQAQTKQTTAQEALLQTQKIKTLADIENTDYNNRILGALSDYQTSAYGQFMLRAKDTASVIDQLLGGGRDAMDALNKFKSMQLPKNTDTPRGVWLDK